MAKPTLPKMRTIISDASGVSGCRGIHESSISRDTVSVWSITSPPDKARISKSIRIEITPTENISAYSSSASPPSSLSSWSSPSSCASRGEALTILRRRMEHHYHCYPHLVAAISPLSICVKEKGDDEDDFDSPWIVFSQHGPAPLPSPVQTSSVPSTWSRSEPECPDCRDTGRDASVDCKRIHESFLYNRGRIGIPVDGVQSSGITSADTVEMIVPTNGSDIRDGEGHGNEEVDQRDGNSVVAESGRDSIPVPTGDEEHDGQGVLLSVDEVDMDDMDVMNTSVCREEDANKHVDTVTGTGHDCANDFSGSVTDKGFVLQAAQSAAAAEAETVALASSASDPLTKRLGTLRKLKRALRRAECMEDCDLFTVHRTFLDSVDCDARIEPDLCLRLMSFFARHGDVDAAFSVLRYFLEMDIVDTHEPPSPLPSQSQGSFSMDDGVDTEQKLAMESGIRRRVIDRPRETQKAFLILCDAIGESHERSLSRRHSKLQIRPCLRMTREEEKEVMMQSLRSISNNLYQQLCQMDMKTHQRVCLPRLLVALCKAPNDFVLMELANRVYRYTRHPRHRNNFPFDASLWDTLLVHGSVQTPYVGRNPQYRKKKEYVPCHEILSDLVENGYYPDSDVVMTVLQNEYPFRSTSVVASILRSIIFLRKEIVSNSDSAMFDNNDYMYRVDQGTLDEICIASATNLTQDVQEQRPPRSRQKNDRLYEREMNTPEVVLLTWDLAESLGYHPSEAMYEATIHAFLRTRAQDPQAFAVLQEMEMISGYTPSTALTRGVGWFLRSSTRRIDNVYYILNNRSPGTAMSTSALNCVLSAYGILGLVDGAFAILEEFTNRNIQLNDDSFGFLMEAVANHSLNLLKRAGSESTTMDNINTPIRHDKDVVDERTKKSFFFEHNNENVQNELLQMVKSADALLAMMADQRHRSDKDQGHEKKQLQQQEEQQKQSQTSASTTMMTRYILNHYIRTLAYAGEMERAKCILEESYKTFPLKGDFVPYGTIYLFAKQCAFKGYVDMARTLCEEVSSKAGYRQTPKEMSAVIESTLRHVGAIKDPINERTRGID